VPWGPGRSGGVEVGRWSIGAEIVISAAGAGSAEVFSSGARQRRCGCAVVAGQPVFPEAVRVWVPQLVAVVPRGGPW
jgi:hypothetical protein